MKYIGLISSDARGASGGNVASRNRFGTYLRAHVSGVQPRTTSQVANRNAFGALSSAWRGLTAAQTQGWNTLATTVTFKDSLGNSYSPTGAQLYMLFSRNLNRAGIATAATAPTAVPAIPAITGLTATWVYGFTTASVTLTGGGTGYASTGTFTVTWTKGTTASGTYVAGAGVITSLTLTVFGSGQSGTATFAFSGGGTGATATATLSPVLTPEYAVSFTPTPVPASVYMFFYASKAVSVGTSFTSKSQLRFLGYAMNGATSSQTLHSQWTTAFGSPPNHGRIRTKAHYIDNTTGYPGPETVVDVDY
jgi:hypothetical protein